MIGFNCARRATTASSWGLREHGNPHRIPPLSPLFYSLPPRIWSAEEGMPWLASTARIERCNIPRIDPSKLACFSLPEWHPCRSHCGRRASTFRSCALREQGISTGVIPFLLSCAFCEQRSRPLGTPLLLLSLKGSGNSDERMVELSSTARVQRGPSQAARCASKEDGPTIPYPHTLFRTSRYASSIFPKSFRNRSLSIDSFVV